MKPLITAFIFILFANSHYAIASDPGECQSVENYAAFREKLADMSRQICVKEPIESDGNFSWNYNSGFQGEVILSEEYSAPSGSVAIKIKEDHDLDLENIKFKNFGSLKIAVDGKVELRTAAFEDAFFPVKVKDGGFFKCDDCTLTASRFDIGGDAEISNSNFRVFRVRYEETDYLIDWLGFIHLIPIGTTTTYHYYSPLVVDSAGQVRVRNNEFIGQLRSDVPYISISNGAVDITDNTFSYKGAVVDVEGADTKVMLVGNKFIKTTAVLRPNALIGGVVAGKLEEPRIEYLGHDTTHFMIRVDNKFTAGSWGAVGHVCSGSPLRTVETFRTGGMLGRVNLLAVSRHINFEPYLVDGGSLYPLGLYGATARSKTVRVPLETRVDDSSMGDEGSIKGADIVILVHCEGVGTTRFSEGIKLDYCGDGKVRKKDGSCFSTCESAENCDGGLVCIAGACQACTEDPQCGEGRNCEGGECRTPQGCESNDECEEGLICMSQKCQPCTVRPRACGSGEICNDEGRCVVKPACDDTNPCDDYQECRDGKCEERPVCSADSECGAGAYCDPVRQQCAPCNIIDDAGLTCLGTNEITVAEDGSARCSDGSAPVCPPNSHKVENCNVCACNDGFEFNGSYCVNEKTGLNCSPGEVYNPVDGSCSKSAAAPPAKKGGGCSLTVR